MKTILYLLTTIILLSGCQPVVEEKSDWTQLFNGEDLDGWIPKIRGYSFGENVGNTFRVEDGKMVVSYEKYDQFNETFGHIFYEKPFSHYVLAVEYRFVGDQCPGGPGWAIRNSGMMLHCQDPETMGFSQDFPISIEAQLLSGNGTDPRPTNNLCTPGTNVVMADSLFEPHCINSTSETYHLDSWVRAEVMVYGDSLIRHIVEGDTVLTYSKPQIGGGNVDGHNPEDKVDGTPLTSGYISLQSESHPIEFRKVELMNLVGCMDKKAKNYRSHYVKGNKSKCVY